MNLSTAVERRKDEGYFDKAVLFYGCHVAATGCGQITCSTGSVTACGHDREWSASGTAAAPCRPPRRQCQLCGPDGCVPLRYRAGRLPADHRLEGANALRNDS